MFPREIKIPQKHSFFLFGPRQTGKSTLLKSYFDDKKTYFYNLLRSEEYLRLAAKPWLLGEEVRARPKTIQTIIIDEIQKIPLLLNEVHDLIQNEPDLQFVLTGSSARKLKTKQANLLAGRALTLRFHPLTNRELPQSHPLIERLSHGTLPAVVSQKEDQLKKMILKSYVETYLKEEIEAEARLKKLDNFLHFLNLAAQENGNILNFSNIARETGTSPKTIQAYFQLLEDTLIGFFLAPFHKSKRKRLSKKPKFYFFDTGIVRSLKKQIMAPLVEKTQDFGDAFEHYLILEILRVNDYLNKDWDLSFFRTESGTEVDMIIQNPKGEMIAIEIKSSPNLTSKHFRGLKSFGEEFKKAKLYCVSTVPRQIKFGGVLVLPWQAFLDQLYDDKLF